MVSFLSLILKDLLASAGRAMPINYLIQFGRLIGLAMLLVATAVFLYYTAWTLLMVYIANNPKVANRRN